MRTGWPNNERNIEMAQEIVSGGIEFYVGSGNVFADLGLPNPEELQLKATLSIEIEQAIKKKRLTKKQAALLLGLSKEEIAHLLGHGFSDLPISQMIGYLRCLGYDVELFATVRERVPEAQERVPEKEREAVAV
jgi:predicted XRE-type DNA-binding protein